MRCPLGLWVLFMLLTATASAQNFRVATEISSGDEVRGSSNTIFFQGRVFDVSDPKGKEFTVYDPTQKRIRLINLREGIQTQLPTSEIEQFTAALKLRAPKVKRPFAIDPQFEDKSDEKTIRLVSDALAYEAMTTDPKFPKAVGEYRRFADWMSQLNAMDTKNLPPFARMQLNHALAQRNKLPLQVQLRLGDQVYSSTHRYYWVLSRQDRELCERIGGYLADPKITIVDYKTYRSAAIALKR